MTAIRLRVCLAVVEEGKILLVPHFETDAGPIQWVVPGGGIEFGESAEVAAVREFREETGYIAACDYFFDLYEVIIPERPWHSVTLAFCGHIAGGETVSEQTQWGPRTPRWFSMNDLTGIPYHPAPVIEKALNR